MKSNTNTCLEKFYPIFVRKTQKFDKKSQTFSSNSITERYVPILSKIKPKILHHIKTNKTNYFRSISCFISGLITYLMHII